MLQSLLNACNQVINGLRLVSLRLEIRNKRKSSLPLHDGGLAHNKEAFRAESAFLSKESEQLLKQVFRLFFGYPMSAMIDLPAAHIFRLRFTHNGTHDITTIHLSAIRVSTLPSPSAAI